MKDDSVRFGLIGFGAWGSCHAAAIAATPGAELVAICAASASTCERATAAYPSSRVYDDVRRMLEESELDVVDIVVPSHLHHRFAAQVLESGRHVLLEKPMCLSLDDCDDLIARAEQGDRLLAIGHELRLSSLWSRVKQMVDEGFVGDPKYVLVELSRNPYRTGSQSWRYDIDRVGNWILEEPIHFFDLARWYLAAAGEPLAVDARANSIQTGHPELHDNFTALVDFPNGVYAVVSQTLAAFEHHQTVKVTGTTGALWASWSGAMDRTRHPSFSLRAFDGRTVRDISIDKITGELFELEDQIAMVLSAIRESRAPIATAMDGRMSVALSLAAHASVESGGRVTVEPPMRTGTPPRRTSD